MIRRILLGTIAVAGVWAVACSADHVTGMGAGRGQLAVQLKDAPVPFDSVKEVDIWVVRVDARRANMSILADIDKDIDTPHMEENDEDHALRDSTLWVTIAKPDSALNLLKLQGGITAFLGATAIDTGHFKAIRMVIDPAKSKVVLKDGTVLTMQSTPPIEFEQRGRHGLFVEFDNDVDVEDGATTTITLDFRLGDSITLKGRTVRDGLVFRPVVTGHSEREH